MGGRAATGQMPAAPEPGDFVFARGKSWIVERAEKAGSVPTLHLVSCEDDSQGETIQLAFATELQTQVLDPNDWSPLLTKSFEGPQRLGAYLRSTEWRTATAADRKLFQAPFRAGIRLDSYQLLPLAKALDLPRVNLLIADDVGLGKTVEAGLIVRELLLRRRIEMIVVAAPASMLLQWQDELAQKFGLDFTIVDREHLLETRRTRGFSANPWSVGSRFIVSHSVLSEETYMGGLRDNLSPFRPGSMLILDEAHHAAPSSGTAWALESQMTRSVREIAALFEHRLFLSATPHNGHSNSFATLLEILDPQRFTRGIDVEAKELEPVMVRRLKEDLRRLGHAVSGTRRRAHPDQRIAAGRPRIAAGRHARRLPAIRGGRRPGALSVRQPPAAPILLDRGLPPDADHPPQDAAQETSGERSRRGRSRGRTVGGQRPHRGRDPSGQSGTRRSRRRDRPCGPNVGHQRRRARSAGRARRGDAGLDRGPDARRRPCLAQSTAHSVHGVGRHPTLARRAIERGPAPAQPRPRGPERADPRLHRTDEPRRARPDQDRLQCALRSGARAHPRLHGRGARGPEPSGPLPRSHPRRSALEPVAPRTAQRPHRSQVAAVQGRDLSLLLLRPARGGSRAGRARPQDRGDPAAARRLRRSAPHADGEDPNAGRHPARPNRQAGREHRRSDIRTGEGRRAGTRRRDGTPHRPIEGGGRLVCNARSITRRSASASKGRTFAASSKSP